MFLYCKLFNKKKQLMNMICYVGVQFDCLFESKAESTAECGAYFTLAHSFMVLRIFNVSIHGFLKLQTEIYISLSPDV